MKLTSHEIVATQPGVFGRCPMFATDGSDPLLPLNVISCNSKNLLLATFSLSVGAVNSIAGLWHLDSSPEMAPNINSQDLGQLSHALTIVRCIKLWQR